MANTKYIDTILRFKDKFTGEANRAIQEAEKVKKKAEQAAKVKPAKSQTFIDAGKKIEKYGKTVEKVGKGLTRSVSTPIIGIGVAAVKTAADFEKGMSKVQSISGASEKDMKRLSDKAKEMGAKTKFSASESADAFSYMAMAGWKTKDMLDGIEGVMYLAGATGEDLASTSDIVTDALTAFGMTAKDTNRFVDVLAQAANSTNTDVSKMGEAFKYVAPVAGSLGYSVEDAAVAMGLMANSGIKASQAGTAMRSWFTNMAKPSKQTAEAMDALGLSLTDSSGKIKPLNSLMTEMREKFSGLTEAQKTQYAAAIAGKTGMSGLLAVVNATDEDFKSVTDSINNSAGAAENMYKVANDNLNGALTELKSKAESIAITIGDKLSPYVKKFVGVLQGWADKINNLDDKQMDMIIKIAGVAAAVGPVILVVGKVIKTAGSAVKTIGTIGKTLNKARKGVGLLGKIFKGVGSVMKGAGKLIKGGVGLVVKGFKLLGLKGLAVIVIIGLIAGAAYLIYKNWDKIKAFFIGLGEKFKEFGQKVKDTFERIKTKCTETVTNIIGKVKGFVGKMIDSGGVIGAVFQNIRNRISALKEIFSNVIGFIKNVFTGNWKAAWENVKGIFSGIFHGLIAAAKAPLNGVIGLINGAIGAINKIHVKIPDWVPGIGGKEFGASFKKIPYLAKGTPYFKGGTAVINEKGGEIVDLPRGTRVIPHDKSVKEAYRTGQRQGAKTVHFDKIAETIVIREEADIDRIVEKIAKKLEETSNNAA